MAKSVICKVHPGFPLQGEVCPSYVSAFMLINKRLIIKHGEQGFQNLQLSRGKPLYGTLYDFFLKKMQ